MRGATGLWVSRDKEMTNIVATYPVTAQANRFMDTAALVDGQAGSAYYWFVQPCKTATGTSCAPMAHAGHAYNKISNKVELLSPANATELPNDVTFTLARLPRNQPGHHQPRRRG